MRPQPGFVPHVTTFGQGPRRVLALHCTMGYGGAWTGVVRALGETVTLVAPDMPSHGQSADWDGQSDFADTVYSASLAIMDDTPMDVIGHSFGAATALRLAVTHPERVRSLTVIEPVYFAAAMLNDPDVEARHDAGAEHYVAALAEGDMETAARLFNRLWGEGRTKWDDLPARTRAAMARGIRVVPSQHGFLFDDTAEMLAPGGLDAVAVPTVIMRGEDADPSIISVNDALAEIMPNAHQSVIQGAGHMAPISHPAEVAEELQVLFACS